MEDQNLGEGVEAEFSVIDFVVDLVDDVIFVLVLLFIDVVKLFFVGLFYDKVLQVECSIFFSGFPALNGL